MQRRCDFVRRVGKPSERPEIISWRMVILMRFDSMMKGRRLLKEYSSQDLDERICQLVPRLMSKLSIYMFTCAVADIRPAIDMTARPEQHSADDVYYAPDFEAECQKWHTLQDEDGKEEYLDERYDYVEDASVVRFSRLLDFTSLTEHSLRGT